MHAATCGAAASAQRRQPPFVTELVGDAVRAREASGVPTACGPSLAGDSTSYPRRSRGAVCRRDHWRGVRCGRAGACRRAASSHVARALDEAVARSCCVATGPGRVRCPRVSPEVLDERLGVGRRKALHDRWPAVLGGARRSCQRDRPPPAARRDGRGRTAAIEWAVGRPRRGFADLAYEDAADWYGRALGLVNLAGGLKAFLWQEQHRTVTKTALVSLQGNTYQVDPLLVGRRVELVFDPFDLTRIQVRLRGVPAGTAIPHRIGRHAHLKARPESPPELPAPTGIDYARLIAEIHQAQLGAPGTGVNYAALTGSTPADSTAPTSTNDQIPGQLDLLTDAPTTDEVTL